MITEKAKFFHIATDEFRAIVSFRRNGRKYTFDCSLATAARFECLVKA